MSRFADVSGPEPSASFEATRHLEDAIRLVCVPNTITPTRSPDLTVYAFQRGDGKMHIVYKPSLCVVARGRKIATVGHQAFRYDASQFFFTSVPLPVVLEVEASEAPLVGLVLEIDMQTIAQVALAIEDATSARPHASGAGPNYSFTGRVTSELADALTRLVSSLRDPTRFAVVYPHVLQEVVFEVLVGEEGARLRRTLTTQSDIRSAIEVARYIERHYQHDLSIAELARRSGMSESTLFARFKETTGTSPLRFLKRIRLVKARALLSARTDTVTQVAHAVGYTSSSQFTREFREMFAVTPSEFVKRSRS